MTTLDTSTYSLDVTTTQLPPVINFGSAALKKEIVPEVLAGRKYICLAISEAFAGSDVQGLRCTATKTADGKHYIVNGSSFPFMTNHRFQQLRIVIDKPLTVAYDRYQKVDNEWNLCRLLLDWSQHWKRALDVAYSSRRRSRNQSHQNFLLFYGRNRLR